MTGEAQQVEQEPSIGKRARHLKAGMYVLLGEVVEYMEAARKEGFIIDFSISRDATGVNSLPPDHPVVSKKW